MERDGHIRILPIHVANKIAAGEVVERPASALKELVENAIDAGADRIDITVTAGGRKLVAVRDNGCGMNREDALLSLERQATSKIRDVDDIERIDTLGFRGEAIPSIAAVSRFTLVTRRKDDEAGTRLTVNAGTLAEVAECGAPPGTCVEVRDLFCNVPARRKFLRSYATEEGHIKAIFTVSALAHPELGFSLTIDGRELHRFAPGATLEERLCSLFGRDFADELIAVKGAEGEPAADSAIRVYGYISPPSPQPLRREQFIFVNGRPATAPIIAYALKEAYPAGRAESRPSLILFIDVPPTEVDVNVHPAKREVRFRHPADVKSAIVAALSAALHPSFHHSPTPTLQHSNTPTLPQSNNQTIQQSNTQTIQQSNNPTLKQSNNQTIKQSNNQALPPSPFTAPFQPTPAPIQRPLPLPPASPTPTLQPSNTPTLQHSNNPTIQQSNNQTIKQSNNQTLISATGPWRTFTVLAVTESGYLLLETDAGLVTLNPQAAQERIAYEKLMASFDDAEAAVSASQPLLIPETVHFSPLESARLKSFAPILRKQGFEIEEFGIDTWKIDAVPALLTGRNASAVIASVVYDIGEAGAKRGDRWREELAARSVARAFAGATRKFTIEGATQLVEELGRTKMPYVCPRGRPVMIFTSNRELARKFNG